MKDTVREGKEKKDRIAIIQDPELTRKHMMWVKFGFARWPSSLLWD